MFRVSKHFVSSVSLALCLALVGGNVGWRVFMCGVLMDGMDGGGIYRLVCFSFSGKNDVFVRFNAARSSS